jgi:amidohydrolase
LESIVSGLNSANHPKEEIMKRFVSLLLVLAFSIGQTVAGDPSDEIVTATDRVMPKVIKWRRHLHQYPELSNREFKTAKYVEDHLRSLGLEVRTGIAKTGVVGILRGGKPGPTIALRADMDALPVTERVDIPWASKETTEFNGQTVGVMHACGHDAHVAILMGTAEVLVGMRDKVPGTVVFIFQPAEEGAPAGEEGGAELMVKEGVMDDPKVDAIFGLHINARTESGTIGVRSGAFMASSDWFTIKVKGKQSHGAYPWMGVDPIVTGAQIINGLQSIVSRRTDLTQSPAIITVGRINAGIRENIVPEELVMAGTIRALDEKVQDEIHEKIHLTATRIAESMGATAEVTIERRTPVTYNSPELVKKVMGSLERAAGSDNVKERLWVTGAEDFAFYRTKAPAFFFYLGGMPKGLDPSKVADHHTPEFFVEDTRLDVGIKAFVNIVFDYSK